MDNETGKTGVSGAIGGIVILFLIGWFFVSLFDNSCKFNGCERDGAGWTNSTSVLGKSTFDGGCSTIPCNPYGSKNIGGYCSREHALAEMGK